MPKDAELVLSMPSSLSFLYDVIASRRYLEYNGVESRYGVHAWEQVGSPRGLRLHRRISREIRVQACQTFAYRLTAVSHLHLWKSYLKPTCDIKMPPSATVTAPARQQEESGGISVSPVPRYSSKREVWQLTCSNL